MLRIHRYADRCRISAVVTPPSGCPAGDFRRHGAGSASTETLSRRSRRDGPHVRHAAAMRQWAYLTGLVVLLWAAGCAHVPTAPERQPPPVTPPAAAVPAPSPAAPPFRTAAEDPKDGPCIQTTHGCIALNPDVDEDTIGATICVPGYTKSVRPATSRRPPDFE